MQPSPSINPSDCFTGGHDDLKVAQMATNILGGGMVRPQPKAGQTVLGIPQTEQWLKERASATTAWLDAPHRRSDRGPRQREARQRAQLGELHRQERATICPATAGTKGSEGTVIHSQPGPTAFVLKSNSELSVRESQRRVGAPRGKYNLVPYRRAWITVREFIHLLRVGADARLQLRMLRGQSNIGDAPATRRPVHRLCRKVMY